MYKLTDILYTIRNSHHKTTDLTPFSQLISNIKIKDLKAYLYINNLRGKLKITNGRLFYESLDN